MKAKPLTGGVRWAALGVAFLFCVVLAGTALAGMFSSEPSPDTYEAQLAPNISFTVTNTDPLYNITNITVIFPTELELVSGSDYANMSGAIISNTTTSFMWGNNTPQGILENGSSAYLNLSFYNMTALGNYSFELNISFTDGSYDNDTHNVTITDNTPPFYQNDQDNSSSLVESGDYVAVSVYWDDIVELDYAILRTNETGSEENRSYHEFSAKPEYSNFSIDTTGQPNETICWFVWANDTSGNLNSSMGASLHCFEVVDTTAPAEIIPSPGETPDNGSWTNLTGAWINFTFTEINPEGCNLSLNNGTGSGTFVMDLNTSPNKCSFQPSYGEGYWNYIISVNDTSDNMGTNGTYYFGYDNTPPVLNSLGIFQSGENVSEGNITSRTNVTISVNITDATSGVNSSTVWANVYNDSSDIIATVTLNQANGNYFNGTWDTGSDNTGDGVYAIHVNGTDNAGNTPSQGLETTLKLLGAPDLIVSDVTWTSDNANSGWPNSGNDIYLNITIMNIGDDNFTGMFNMTVDVDIAEQNRTMLDNSSLDEGESRTLNVTINASDFSTNKYYTFDIEVDPASEDAITESSETNNTYTLGLSLGYNISLVKIYNGSQNYFPPDVAQTFPSTNITVNFSVTYANGSGVTGLTQGQFGFWDSWSGWTTRNTNMSERINSFGGTGGYYVIEYETPELLDDSGGNRTRPRFGDNYINITALSGSYSGDANITYNITAPDINVHIDIDDVDLQGDTNGYWIDFNLSITNNGNAPAYSIFIDEVDDWFYDESVFYDLDADVDLNLGVLLPGETHKFPDGSNDLRIDAIGTSSGSDRVLWVFVHYNDSVNNTYQGFDYDKTDIDNSGTGDEGEDDGTTGTTTGGDLVLEVTLTDWDDVIEGYPGESNTTRVKVKNTGDVTVVAKVRFTCEVMQGTPTIAPISKSIAVNSDQEFIIDFNINSDAEIGEYNCEVEAYVSSSEDDYDRDTIVLKILPTEEMAADIEGKFENLSLEVEELLDRFSRVNPSLVNDTNMSRVQDLMNSTNNTLNEIREAIEGGDYLTAHSLIESLQASLISTTQALKDLELEHTMGGGVTMSVTWFWAVIIIVVVIAVAFVAYLMFPQKSYGPKKSIFGTLADTVKGGTSKAGVLKDSGKSKTSSLSSKKPFKPSSYAGDLSKKPGYSYSQGPGAKIKGAFSKLKEKLKRKKKPQKEVTQYFVNSSSNIINYS